MNSVPEVEALEKRRRRLKSTRKTEGPDSKREKKNDIKDNKNLDECQVDDWKKKRFRSWNTFYEKWTWSSSANPNWVDSNNQGKMRFSFV